MPQKSSRPSGNRTHIVSVKSRVHYLICHRHIKWNWRGSNPHSTPEVIGHVEPSPCTTKARIDYQLSYHAQVVCNPITRRVLLTSNLARDTLKFHDGRLYFPSVTKAAHWGIEPQLKHSECFVLPLHYWAIKYVEGAGFEPAIWFRKPRYSTHWAGHILLSEPVLQWPSWCSLEPNIA